MYTKEFPQPIHDDDGNSAEQDEAPLLPVQGRRAKYAAAKKCQQELDENNASHNLEKARIIRNMVQQIRSFHPDVKPVGHRHEI